MKKYIAVLTALSVMASNAMAIESGFYLGAQFGYAKAQNEASRLVVVQPNPLVTTPTTSSKTSGLSPKIYAGYQINSYLGVEIGGAFYPTTDYQTGNVTVPYPPKRRMTMVDFLAKGTWELSDTGFNVYGKAGLAYVSVKQSNNLNPSNLTADMSLYERKRSIRPEIGLGAGYAVSQNAMVDVSISRIFKGSDFPAMNMLGLGFTYSFADARCGQFLC